MGTIRFGNQFGSKICNVKTENASKNFKHNNLRQRRIKFSLRLKLNFASEFFMHKTLWHRISEEIWNLIIPKHVWTN